LNIPHHFWGLSLGFGDGVFYLLVAGTRHPRLVRRAVPTRHQWTCWSDGGSHFSRRTGERVLVAQRNPEKAWEPIGISACQTGKNPGSNDRPEAEDMSPDHLPETPK
jgi:hypothetical protein